MVTIIDSTNITSIDNSKKLQYGRQRIILNYDKVTPDNFLEVFNKALPIHRKNEQDCDYLIHMFLGKQDILNRTAPNTSNINNQTVVNYALPITREIVGYTFGSPVELVQRNSEKREDVQLLSDILDYENSYYHDICSAMFCSICGVGYQITLPSKDINEDNTPEQPIIIDSLDPRSTFVVQSTNVGNPQIMSCMVTCDSNGNNKKYIAFTNEYKFIIDTTKDSEKESFTYEINPIGLDPITMIENSLFLTGDWEQAISVLNAINQITSDSLNDIEGTIKSLLVLIGCEIDDSEDNGTLKKIKDKRLLSIANGNDQSGQLDAKFISPQLESTSVQNIREFLEDARNVITGIPDRSANSSGGDTGQAVLNRDGWTDIEIVAKLKELFFKKAKHKQIAIIVKILQILNVISKDLKAMDITVNIGRHTTDNLGTKTTAFSTLVATGELATIDCLEMSGLTTRVNEVVERGKKEKEEKRAESLEFMKQEAALNAEGYKKEDINKDPSKKVNDNNKK